jgi:hypothetical protein
MDEVRIITVTTPAKGGSRSEGWRSPLARVDEYRPPEIRQIEVRGVPADLGDELLMETINEALRRGYGCPLPLNWPVMLSWLDRRPA